MTLTPLYSTKAGGTGLGLYVVQEIVKAHAGTVEVTSTPGSGTTFTLRLPLVTDEKDSVLWNALGKKCFW